MLETDTGNAEVRPGRAGKAALPGAWLMLACLVLAAGANAAEVVVQNDSVPGGGAGTPLTVFLGGEKVAAWLTAPVSGDVVAVQIDWRSQFGGAPPSLETAITVHAAGFAIRSV